MKNRSNQFLQFVSLLFFVWIAAVAFIDVRTWNWWHYADTIQATVQRLQPIKWHSEVFIEHGKALLFFLWFMMAALGLGLAPAKFLLPDHPRREHYLVAVLLGMTGLGLLMFFAGIVGLWQPATVIALLTVFSVWGIVDIIREWNGLRQDLSRAVRCLSRWDILILIVSLFIVVLVVLYALSPPVQSDALRYHLAAIDRWRQVGRITYLPGFAHSNLPFLVEMNFACALLLGLPAGAQLVHVAYYLSAAGMVGLLAQRLTMPNGPRFIHPSIIAAAILLTHPVAAPLAAWAYVDLATVAYLLGMIWALAQWMEKRRRGLLVLAGILAGAAFATKYTNLLPIALTAVIVFFWQDKTQPLKRRIVNGFFSSVAFLSLAVAICSPWLIRNTINTGNPVYPLAYSIFGGPDWSAENAAFYSAKAAEKGTAPALLQQKWREASEQNQPPPSTEDWEDAAYEYPREKLIRYALTPWTTYRWPGAFEDFAQGPLLLLVLPIAILMAALVMFRRSATMTKWICGLFAAFLFATWCVTYQSNRFLLPVPILLAAFLSAWTASSSVIRIPARLAVAFLLIAQSSWVAQYILAKEPYGALRPVLGCETTGDYLVRSVNYYDAARWLNANAAGKGAFLAGEHRTFYFNVPLYAADWFDTPAPLRLIRQSNNTDEALDYLLDNGFGYMLLNAQELLGGMNAAQEAIKASPNPDLLQNVMALGLRGIDPNAPKLGASASNYDYFRRRFNDAEWSRWIELLRSPRLRRVYQSNPLIIAYQINPK